MTADVRTRGAEATSLLLAGLFDLRPERYLRRIPGRETFAWDARALFPSERGAHPAVVKRMRGGAGADGLRETLRGRRPRSPGRREFDNLAALALDGIRAPRPLAYSENGAAKSLLPATLTPGRRARSLVVMEAVPEARTLRDVLAACPPAERERWATRLLALVTRLHRRGWIHRDLYLQHFLIGSDRPGELVLVDVGRARRAKRVRRRWWVKDVAALESSCPESVPRFSRLRFLARWLDALGIQEPRARRRFAAAVCRKARAIRGHRPRFVDPASDPPGAGT